MTLSDDSQLLLAERLLSTVADEPSLESVQLQEVHRHIEEVRTGKVKTIPGEQVFREIQQSLAARRKA